MYANRRLEVIAFHPLYGTEESELKVMTWNIHCSEGSDSMRQCAIAEVILQEDADVVLLNEFFQDSCRVVDSLLKSKYDYTEEYQSHRKCGDIIYSKRKLGSSGHPVIREVWKAHFAKDGESFPDSLNGKSIQAIKATVSVGRDSVLILGCHWPSNSGDGSGVVNGVDSLRKIESFYEHYKKKQKLRNFQAFWTAEVVKDSPYPVIVMGDMNDFSCSAPLDILTECGLKDAWWEGGLGYGCTFHTGWMRLRIDHVMYGEKLKLQNVRVVSTDLSDHNPIIANFSINN